MDVLGFATLGFAFDGVPGSPGEPAPPQVIYKTGGFVGSTRVQTHHLATQDGLRLRSASTIRPIYQPRPQVFALASVGGLRLSSASTITLRRSTRELEDLALLGLARP